jgi:phage terminase small subunit
MPAAKTPRPLPLKRQRFVDAFVGEFSGNAAGAARKAGYSERSAKAIGQQLLTFADVKAAIAKARAPETDAAIATRSDRQAFLTKVMNDAKEKTKDRLKACEVLGRMNGDFLDRHEVSGPGGATAQIIFMHNGRGPALDPALKG